MSKKCGGEAGAVSGRSAHSNCFTSFRFLFEQLEARELFSGTPFLSSAAQLAPMAATLSTAAATSSGSLVGQQSTASSGYNLTTLGTTDWIHWGRGGTYGATDRKSTGNKQISDVTVVGTGANVGGWHDSSRASTWTGGSPTASDTNDSGYIWSNGALNTGYSFTVPADTTSRTLTVYAGGYGTVSSVRAHLSDGSAADYVATASGAGTYTNIYTITYSAASAGQTLTITLLKTGNITGTQGSADLIAAALSTAAVSTPVPAAPNIYEWSGNDNGFGFFDWFASPGATSYNIYRSTTPGGEGSTPYKTGIAATQVPGSNA